MKLLLAIACMLLNSTVALAQSKIIDPFFLIEYDPNKVHFEAMPLDLPKQCADLRGRYVRAWVYSHVKAADTEYYVIYGNVRAASDSHPRRYREEPEEGDGLTAAIRGSRCLVDQSDFFLTQDINRARGATPIIASEAILRQIAREMFQRYVKAFGSKAKFLQNVSPQAAAELPPVVKAEFESFVKRP